MNILIICFIYKERGNGFFFRVKVIEEGFLEIFMLVGFFCVYVFNIYLLSIDCVLLLMLNIYYKDEISFYD